MAKPAPSELHIAIPGDPVPCARARVYRDPRTGKTRGVTPAKTRAYKAHVRMLAAVACQRVRWAPCTGPVGVVIEVYRREARGDWDNFAKTILDALNGVVYDDDRRIVDACVSIREDKHEPRVYVDVWRVETRARQAASDEG